MAPALPPHSLSSPKTALASRPDHNLNVPHPPRPLAIRKRLHERLIMCANNLGHLLLEVRVDAHLLEYCWSALCLLLPECLPVEEF